MSTNRNKGAWARWKDACYEDELDTSIEFPPIPETAITTSTDKPETEPDNTHLASLLDSSIPELRIIGQHFQAGLDGHPFNTGDVVADTQPTSRLSY